MHPEFVNAIGSFHFRETIRRSSSPKAELRDAALPKSKYIVLLSCSVLAAAVGSLARARPVPAQLYIRNFPAVYLYALRTRKSAGLMMRKLSVTESQRIAQFFGTSSRRKCRTARQKSL